MRIGIKSHRQLAGLLLAVVLVGCAPPTVVLNDDDGRPAPPSLEDLPAARVVDVVDGDTVRVVLDGQEYTLRYIGIDTPETVHPERPVEWMGPEASAANQELVAGQAVYLEKDVSETDRFGRLLRYVYLADGTMVNEELVRRGYAHSSAFPPDVKHQDLLDRAERDARQAGCGLWGATPGATAAAVQATATATRPAALASPQPVQSVGAGPAGVVIVSIQANGAINPAEPDEYAEIRNDGATAVDLTGWRLNAGSEGQDFLFPAFALQPGQACRVYTDEIHPASCGFSFGSSQAVWRNGGDCARLYDASGSLVADICY